VPDQSYRTLSVLRWAPAQRCRHELARSFSTMRLQQIVRAPKTEVMYDQWKSGRMNKVLFPLGKSGKHALSLGSGFDWCFVRFKALGCEFRLLIALQFAKQEYYAHLGRALGSDTQMLASYEFHGTHPGWHLHVGCGDTTLIPIGRYKGPWKHRIPGATKRCRRASWEIENRFDALSRACSVFGVPMPGIYDDVDHRQMRLV
jgi:hypothetical protein